MKTKLFTLIFIFSLVFSIFGVNIVEANINNAFNVSENTAVNAGYDSSRNVDILIVNIINIVFSFLGVIFLALIIYGGVLWMTASGNEEQVKKAKGVIKNSVIGLVIVLAAYAISWFVTNTFFGEQRDNQMKKIDKQEVEFDVDNPELAN